MKILGLTGDIAAGKSTVAHLLEARGAHHLDADLGVRELYERPEFAERIAAMFGDILDKAGRVDRIKLGAVVFSNARKLGDLESLVHPAVARLREQQLEELRGAGTKAVVIEAVKLLESGQSRSCDEVWCVVTWKDRQIQRLMDKRNLSRDEAQARLDAQPSPEAKRVLAGRVPLLFLSNNGSLRELETQVDAHWSRFLAS